MNLYWYNPGYLEMNLRDLDTGLDLLTEFNRMTTLNSILVDRTNTIKTPFNIVNEFPLPAIELYNLNYTETCLLRARQLLDRAKLENKELAVMWSGGIDSTLIVVLLLMEASLEERKNITILVSPPSIAEYSRFFEEHIFPNFNVESCVVIESIWKENRLVISGEGNDQLLGSDIIKDLIALKGVGYQHQKLDKDVIKDLFLRLKTAEDKVARNMDILDELMFRSLVPINSYLDYFWWINFATKWQCVYFRTLSYASNQVVEKGLAWVRDRYTLFFEGPEFTQWALNNPAAGFKDTWHSYKWQAKEIIYDYNKDQDYYQNKGKFGSLMKLAYNNVPYNFISDQGWHKTVNDPHSLLVANHSFK